MLFPFCNAPEFFYRKRSYVFGHMVKHRLKQFFHFRFAENCKIHFVFSFQNVVNAGNQTFHTFLFGNQHFSLHLQDLISFKSRVVHNRFDFFQGNIEFTEKQDLL